MPNTNTNNAEALAAELAAVKAELEALRNASVKPATALEVWRTPHTPNDSNPLTLLSRHVLIVSSFKAIRAMKWADLPEVLELLTRMATKDGSPHGTYEKALAKFITDDKE